MRPAAEEVALAAGDLPGLLRVAGQYLRPALRAGHYAESAEVAESGWPTRGGSGWRRTTGVFLLANRGEALVALGRWDEADALFAEAARLDPPGTLALLWLVQRARAAAAPAGIRPPNDTVARAVGFLSRPYLPPPKRLPLHELRVAAALRRRRRADRGSRGERRRGAARRWRTSRATLAAARRGRPDRGRRPR